MIPYVEDGEGKIMHLENLLLTGAGFTATWGGFLNEEMRANIFNQQDVKNNAKVRSKLLSYSECEAAQDQNSG
jgi:hypothetical protein